MTIISIRNISNSIIIFLLFFILAYNNNYSFLESISIGYSLSYIRNVIIKFGRKIILLEVILAIAIIEIIFVPAITYHMLPSLMAVDSNTYFAYALPSTIFMVIGFSVNWLNIKIDDISYFNAAKIKVSKIKKNIYYIYPIGLIIYLIKDYLPEVIHRPLIILSFPFFVGVFYLYLTNISMLKKNIVFFFSISIVGYFSIRNSFFGEFLYWIIIWSIFLTVYLKIILSPILKFLLICCSLYIILIIQSVKEEYRSNTWTGSTNSTGIVEIEPDGSLFFKLVKKRVENTFELLESDFIIPIALQRLNQGYYLAETMDYIPRKVNYVKTDIFYDFVIPLVPRLFWQNKPLVSSSRNVDKYTRFEVKQGNNYDISPLGEAYANFGYFGILFMFFFGTLFKIGYQLFFKYSKSNPTLFLWVPCVFLEFITSMENSFLIGFSGFLTASIGLFLVFKFFKLINFKL